MKLILKILITAGSLLLLQEFISGIVVENFYTALIVALLLGVVNLTIRPILLILSFPLNFFSLGLFTFVVNGALFWFISTFVEGFRVSGFFVAVLGAFIVSVFKWLGDKLISDD